MTATKEKIIESFRLQARWCEQLGSPFTARLVARAADALEGDGPLAALLPEWPGDPVADGLPLRFAAALHALVLAKDDMNLAAVYPPHEAETETLWRAAEAALATRGPHFARFLASPPQTNEVRRSALLLPGFLEIARMTGKPLRLLEIGASAGLNLIWDKYRYRYGEQTWGDPYSPVELPCEWQGPPYDFEVKAEVASRAACDRAPVDIEDPGQVHRLRGYIWADQRDRLARLDAALALARRLEIRVDAAEAAPWLDRQFDEAPGDAVTVVYHSVVWQYLPKETRTRLRNRMKREGAKRPLAWLAFEIAGPTSPYELRLRFWPGDRQVMTDRVLATASPHGAWIKWANNG